MMRAAGFVFGVLMPAGFAFAQTAGVQVPAAATFIDRSAGTSPDEAVAQALLHEPSLRAARTEIDVAHGMRTQAGLRPNPSVSFSRQGEPGGTDNQTQVQVQWPLDLFRRTARVKVAEERTTAAELAVADRERRLAGEVRLAYGDAAAAVRALSVTEDLLTATTRQLTLTGARVDAGAATPLEQNMLRVEAQRLEAERLVQAGVVDGALVRIKRLMGLPADAAFRLRESLETLVQEEAAALPRDGDALATRPDVLEAEARVAVSGARIDSARREGRPDVSLFGGYMRMDAGFPQRAFGEGGDLQRIQGVFHYASAGAMVTLPLLNRNQGELAVARAERLAAEAELDAARLTAASEAAAARIRDERARQALAAYTTGTMDLARQNLEVVRQTYELGRVTLFDVFDEQRRYLDLERSYTAALREAYDARQTLRQALGEVR